MTIFILCGNAAYNRGDRFNLLAQLRLLRERFPQARIVYASYRADVDARRYPCEVIQRPLLFSLSFFRALRGADVVVWGGGALIADNGGAFLIPYWLALIAAVRRVLRKPVMAWAHGLVVETRIGAFLGRLALRIPDTVTVRDAHSWETLERIGARRRSSHLTADPAILTVAESREAGEAILRREGVQSGREVFAVTPTFWPFYHRKRDLIPYLVARRWGVRGRRSAADIELYKTRLTRLADRLVDAYDAEVVFVPNFPRRPWKDLEHLVEVAAAARRPERVHVIRSDDDGPAGLAALWSRFDFLVTMSLHSSIVATALGRPCVHAVYEAKGRSFFERLDGLDRLVDMGPHFEIDRLDELLDAIERTRRHWPAIKRSLEPIVEDLRSAARRNADYLADLTKKRA